MLSRGAPAAERELEYALELDSTVTARGDTILDFRLTADWVIAGVERHGDELLVRSELRHAALKSSSARPGDDPKLRAFELGFGKPHFFSIDARGAVRETRLSRSMPSFVQGVVKWLIAERQLVRPEGDATAWTIEESDTAGRYQARYVARGAGSFEKQKLRYLTSTRGASYLPVAADTTEVLESQATFTLGKSRQIESLTAHERTRVRGTGPLPEMLANTRLELRLKSARQAAQQQSDWRAQLGSCEPSRLEDALPSSALQADIDESKIAGRSLPQVLSGIRRNAGSERDQIVERDRLYVALAALLRHDETARADAVARITRGDPDAALLIDALGDAGTPEAQQSLALLVSGTRLDKKQKRAALISLSLVDAPTDTAVASLSAMQDDPELGRQATYGLGAYAYQLRQSAPARAQAILNGLLGRLRNANGNSETRRYLEALGNAGHPGALQDIDRYLSSADEQLRGGALRALRRIDGAEVDQRLAATIMHDSAAGVRSMALRIVDHRTRSEALSSAIEACVRHERDASVRLDATRILTQWMSQERRLLATANWLLTHDPDESIRASVRRALEVQTGS